MSEPTLEELKAAVIQYLDLFYEDDEQGSRISWPSELEHLVGWVEPQNMGDADE